MKGKLIKTKHINAAREIRQWIKIIMEIVGARSAQ